MANARRKRVPVETFDCTLGPMREAADSASGAGNVGLLRIGRYAIAPPFARGGVASVHLACRSGDGGFARTVVVKRLHPQHARNPDFSAMFIDEARLSASVHHTNVVSVHDVAAVDGELLLVMEYIHGVSLADLLARSRREGLSVSVGAAVAIASDVLAGLFAANTATDSAGALLGLVHRDVSPQNILVGADGVCRLVDFGIARAHQRLHETKDGRVRGKPAYLSPELLIGEVASPRSDQYSCAVVIWELLAGQALHARGTAAATALRVLEGKAPDIRTVRADVPAALAEALALALSKNPADRFADARQLANAVASAQPRASRAELAHWVQRGFGSELDDRARECERLERAAAARSGAFRRAPTALAAIAAAVMIVGIGAVTTLRHGSAGARVADSPRAAFAAAVPSATLDGSAVRPRPRVAPEPQPDLVSPAPEAESLDASPERVRRSRGVPRASCDPPWRYVEGIKRFKPECL